MGFGKDFGRGLARTGPASAQQAAFLALRQALEEPRTEAELQMRERQLRLSEDENRIRMDLLREQLVNARADTQFESESRARASSPEALDRQKRLDEAEIGGKEALKEQREAMKLKVEQQIEQFKDDPEAQILIRGIMQNPAVQYGEPAAAAKYVYEATAELKRLRGGEKAGGKAPAKKEAPKAASPSKDGDTVKIKHKNGSVITIRKADLEKAKQSKNFAGMAE